MEIFRFIRWDKRIEKSQHLQTNKFALVSTVWDKFIKNSQNSFKPGTFITVNEQLFSTKARYRFIQYIPNKPIKFGIKIWLAFDVETEFVINPYLGKDEKRKSSINSWILYESITRKNISSKHFLFQLAGELTSECSHQAKEVQMKFTVQ